MVEVSITNETACVKPNTIHNMPMLNHKPLLTAYVKPKWLLCKINNLLYKFYNVLDIQKTLTDRLVNNLLCSATAGIVFELSCLPDGR